MDWGKIISNVAPPILAALGMWAGLTLRRAARNWGRTDVEIANEELDRATKAAEAAHADKDPGNDADADKKVARARELRVKALRLKAIADALAAEPDEPAPPAPTPPAPG